MEVLQLNLVTKWLLLLWGFGEFVDYEKNNSRDECGGEHACR
jgi:hypothetical protein